MSLQTETPRTVPNGRHARLFTSLALLNDAWAAFNIARAYGTAAEIDAAAIELRDAQAGVRRAGMGAV